MKKTRRILYLLIFILGMLLLCSTKSNAAGTVSLSSNKNTVTVGEEFSISINLSGASVATLTSRITVDTSKVEYVSGPSNSSFSNGRVIYTWTDPTGGSSPITGGTIATFKFKAKASGNASFSVSGDFYTPDEKPVNPSFSSKSVTIKEKEVNPPSTGGNESNTGNGGGTSEGGNTGTPGTPGTGGTGSTGGNNNGQTNVSSNAHLKELHLNVEGVSPGFHKNISKYNLVVSNDINNITVTAVPEDSNAKVSITGNTNLKTGINNINIVVTAQDNKTKKTYVVEVTKTDHPELANANLENLAIENVTLDPEFSPDVITYMAEVGSDADSINILAVPQIEGASVTIEGKDNLQFGDNMVMVKVVAKDGVTDKEYLIKLYKKTREEETIENELLSLEEENTVQENNKISIGNLIFCYIIVIGTGVISYILITKYKKENS